MITKSAQNKEMLTKSLTFTKSARDAWKLIIKSVIQDRGYANILLPSYIGITDREGSGIFDPVESTKADFTFYNMKSDLSIDFESLSKLMYTKKFNILLVVHYFGFCRNDLKKIRELCDQNNVIFVEDCAHAFHLGLKNEKLGIAGDFSIYSIHKHLPVDSGGVLKNISKKIKLINLPEVDRISAEPAVQLLNSDLGAIAEARRKNYSLYADKLSGVEGVEVMYGLEDGVVPQTFPILVKNKMRERLYFHLIDKDMPMTALYYRLLDELSAQHYPFVHEVSEMILNLPVHQDISERDISSITKDISTFLAASI